MSEDPAAATHAALDAYWARIGASDADVISYAINPMFSGAPPWPGTRQAYRVVRVAEAPGGPTLILASDGLSDPFDDDAWDDEDGAPARNGFEMEVYIETPELAGAGFEEIRSSWAFAVIERLAQNVASWGGIAPQLRRFGVMSVAVPLEDALDADGWLAPSGAGGLLLNLAPPGRAREVEGAPLSPILVCAATLLRADELAFVEQKGDAGRDELARRLLNTPLQHRSSLARASVL